MKLNSRGVKVRAFMVGLALLAYLYDVSRRSDPARDGATTEPPGNAASQPSTAASTPLPHRTPEGGNPPAASHP